VFDHHQGRRLVVELLAHFLADDYPRLSAALAHALRRGQFVDAAVAWKVPGQLLSAVPFAAGLRHITRGSRGRQRYGFIRHRLGEQQGLVGREALGPRTVEAAEYLVQPRP
jgi:hypothetical protein